MSYTNKDQETVVKMLSMLCIDTSDANRSLLTMANNPESCCVLRKTGCIPLLVQILHPTNTPIESHPSPETKNRAAKALKNIVAYNPDEAMKRKEMRVLKLLEGIRAWNGEIESHPIEPMKILMKQSFEEESRKVMCLFGAIQAIASVIQTDNKHKGDNFIGECSLIRRYGCMTLTNLTFGDGINKSLLCSMHGFLPDLVSLLDEGEDICQNTASVLRNLSWNADSMSRAQLRECNAVIKLNEAAHKCTKESTLKAILSALWNLTAHSSFNKAAICSEDSIKFLITNLDIKNNVKIQESAGGILRNVSLAIADNEGCRKTCLDNLLYEILLNQLKSTSMQIVINACGTLWNLSICLEAQKKLYRLNAIPMLKALVYSKEEKIAQGASAALRNLICSQNQQQQQQLKYQNQQESEQPLDLSQPQHPQTPVTATNSSSSSSANSHHGGGDQKQQQPSNSQAQNNNTPHPIHKTHSSKKPPFLNPPIVNLKTFSCPNFIEDTVKTFCYEGTPHSNSIQDLTDETVKYFTEHTPAVFSRTSSLSSLNSRGGVGGARGNQADADGEGQAESECGRERENNNKVQDTPLMFSRSSSVESLESFGDLAIPESVASEFSVRQSEVVSPSDLPDSPRNVYFAPPPPPKKIENESGQMSIRSLSPLTVDGEIVGVDLKLSDPPHPSHPLPTLQEKKDEDELKIFAVEGTPFGISTATSLSDLTCELKDELFLEEIKEDLNEIREESSSPQIAHNNSQIVVEQNNEEINEPKAKQKVEEDEDGNDDTAKEEINEGDEEEQEKNKDKKLNESDSGAVGENKKEEIYTDVQILQKCINAGKAKMTKSKSDYFASKKASQSLPKQQKNLLMQLPSHKIHSHSDSKSEASASTGTSTVTGGEETDDADDDILDLIQKGKKAGKKEIFANVQRNHGNFRPISKSNSEHAHIHLIPSSSSSNTKEILIDFPKPLKERQDKKHSAFCPNNINNELASAGKIQINGRVNLNEHHNNNHKINTQTSSSSSREFINKQQQQQQQQNHNLSNFITKPISNEATQKFLQNPVNNKQIQQLISSTTSSIMDKSTASIGSEWNDETPTISSSIPSMSISTALKIVKKENKQNDHFCNSNNKPDLLNSSTMSNMSRSLLRSSSDYSKSAEYLDNIGPPTNFSQIDMEHSLISVASIRSEIAPLDYNNSSFIAAGENNSSPPHLLDDNRFSNFRRSYNNPPTKYNLNYVNRLPSAPEPLEKDKTMTPPPIPPKPKQLPPRPVKNKALPEILCGTGTTTTTAAATNNANSNINNNINLNKCTKLPITLPIEQNNGEDLNLENNDGITPTNPLPPSLPGGGGSPVIVIGIGADGKQKKIPPKPPVRKDAKYNTLPKSLKGEKKVGKIAGFFQNLKGTGGGGFFKDVWVKRHSSSEDNKPEARVKPFNFKPNSNSNNPNPSSSTTSSASSNINNSSSNNCKTAGEKITTV